MTWHGEKSRTKRRPSNHTVSHCGLLGPFFSFLILLHSEVGKAAGDKHRKSLGPRGCKTIPTDSNAKEFTPPFPEHMTHRKSRTSYWKIGRIHVSSEIKLSSWLCVCRCLRFCRPSGLLPSLDTFVLGEDPAVDSD